MAHVHVVQCTCNRLDDYMFALSSLHMQHCQLSCEHVYPPALCRLHCPVAMHLSIAQASLVPAYVSDDRRLAL